MKKLYIGNLPYSYRGEDLETLFADFGPVLSAMIITDKVSRRSKGFGFVELEDEMADKAIESMNQKEVEGRKIVVNEARPREER